MRPHRFSQLRSRLRRQPRSSNESNSRVWFLKTPSPQASCHAKQSLGRISGPALRGPRGATAVGQAKQVASWPATTSCSHSQNGILPRRPESPQIHRFWSSRACPLGLRCDRDLEAMQHRGSHHRPVGREPVTSGSHARAATPRDLAAYSRSDHARASRCVEHAISGCRADAGHKRVAPP